MFYVINAIFYRVVRVCVRIDRRTEDNEENMSVSVEKRRNKFQFEQVCGTDHVVTRAAHARVEFQGLRDHACARGGGVPPRRGNYLLRERESESLKYSFLGPH